MYCKAKRWWNAGAKHHDWAVGKQRGYKEEAVAERERKKLFRRKQPGSSSRWVP
jgi:hypothetical protein